MDWRRAKSILITAFLFLDLFLGYLIFKTFQENTQYVAQNAITDEQINDLAKSKGIHIGDLSKPKEPDEMIVYSGKTTIVNLPSDWAREPNGTYIKKFSSPQKLAKTEKSLLMFLQEQALPHLTDFQLQKPEFRSDRIIVYQMIGNYPIFDGKIELQLNANQQVISMQYTHFTLGEKNFHPHQPNKYNNALASLLSGISVKKHSNQTTSIRSVELGYQRNSYPDIDQRNIFIPMWRFQVGDNYYYVSTTSSDTINNSVQQVK